MSILQTMITLLPLFHTTEVHSPRNQYILQLVVEQQTNPGLTPFSKVQRATKKVTFNQNPKQASNKYLLNAQKEAKPHKIHLYTNS